MHRFDAGTIAVQLQVWPVVGGGGEAAAEAKEEDVRHALTEVLFTEAQRPDATAKSVCVAVRRACFPPAVSTGLVVATCLACAAVLSST